jgi:hypothetical protein
MDVYQVGLGVVLFNDYYFFWSERSATLKVVAFVVGGKLSCASVPSVFVLTFFGCTLISFFFYFCC